MGSHGSWSYMCPLRGTLPFEGLLSSSFKGFGRATTLTPSGPLWLELSLSFWNLSDNVDHMF